MSMFSWVKEKYQQVKAKVAEKKDQIISAIRTGIIGLDKVFSVAFSGYVNGLLLTRFKFRPVILGVALLLGSFLGENSFLHRLSKNNKVKALSQSGGVWLKTTNMTFTLLMGTMNIFSLAFELSGWQEGRDKLDNNMEKAAYVTIAFANLLGLTTAYLRHHKKMAFPDKKFIENRHFKSLVKASMQTSKALGICLYLTELNDRRVDAGYITGYSIAGPGIFLSSYVLYLMVSKPKFVDYLIDSGLSIFHFAALVISAYVTKQIGMNYAQYDDKVPIEVMIAGFSSGGVFGLMRAMAFWPEIKEAMLAVDLSAIRSSGTRMARVVSVYEQVIKNKLYHTTSPQPATELHSVVASTPSSTSIISAAIAIPAARSHASLSASVESSHSLASSIAATSASPTRTLRGVQIKANRSVEFGSTPVSPENVTPAFSV